MTEAWLLAKDLIPGEPVTLIPIPSERCDRILDGLKRVERAEKRKQRKTAPVSSRPDETKHR